VAKRTGKQAETKPIETDPNKLAVLLLRYAFRYAASVGWKAQDRAIARGSGVEDIVQDALSSLYGGDAKRPWDREKHPDPMDHLKDFVESRLSTLARSYDHKKVRFPVDPEQHEAPDTPESLVMKTHAAQDDANWFAEARSRVIDEILDDELLLAMHDLMQKEEMTKPAELAERLNVPLETVKNGKKRINRAWARVVDALGPRPALEREATNG
jgi:DNA-directed RNA polymerase specialized sigma24 family protein